MHKFFKVACEQLANKKWEAGYMEITPLSYGSHNEKEVYLDAEFDTKEDAERFTKDCCIARGLILAHGK